MIIPDSTKAVIQSIDNSQLEWDGTPLGLFPSITNPESSNLVHSKLEIDHLLYKSLKNKNQFAIAHVILTLRNNKPFDSHPPFWNELKVLLKNDNSVEYNYNNIDHLYKKWIQKLEKK